MLHSSMASEAILVLCFAHQGDFLRAVLCVAVTYRPIFDRPSRGLATSTGEVALSCR